MVDGGLALQAEAAREVGLRVEVDEEHALFGDRQGRSQVDGGSRFADTALLVGDGDYPGSHLWHMTNM